MDQSEYKEMQHVKRKIMSLDQSGWMLICSVCFSGSSETHWSHNMLLKHLAPSWRGGNKVNDAFMVILFLCPFMVILAFFLFSYCCEITKVLYMF